MKQLVDILEMSAWHNKANDDLKAQIDKLNKEIEVNSQEDKKRILSAAGLKDTAKISDLYNYAMEIVSNILFAHKPYGALVFLLTHLQECAEKYGVKDARAKEAGETLKKILTSSAIDELISGDKSFDTLRKKISQMKEKSTKLTGETAEISKKLEELEKKYPALRYYRDDQ